MSSKQISVNLPKRALKRLGSTDASKKYSIKLPKYYRNKSKSNFGFIIIILLVFLALIIGLYFLYKHYTDYSISEKIVKMLIDSVYDAKTYKNISSNSLPPSTLGQEFNINFWMYINDYNYRYGEDKIILKREEENNNNFIIQLDKNKNSLSVKILTRAPLVQTDLIESFSNDSLTLEKFTIDNIPLQRWVNINISLINDSLDIFLDGYLKQNFLLKGLPIINSGNLDICPISTDFNKGGFNGFLNNLSYTNKGFSPKDILDIYKKGPTL